MKLWGGRFTKETNQLVHNFNASLSFDQKFYHEDIQGSIAHVTMLADQGILSHEDKDSIIQGLEGIRKDLDEGKLEFTAEHEDSQLRGSSSDRAHRRRRQTSSYRQKP